MDDHGSLRRVPCTEQFSRRLQRAVEQIDLHKGQGFLTREIYSLGKAREIKSNPASNTKSVSIQISWWRKGVPRGLNETVASIRVAKIAAILGQIDPKAAGCLIASYAGFLISDRSETALLSRWEKLSEYLDIPKSAWTSRRGSDERWFLREKTDDDWIMFALALHLRNCLNHPGDSFRIGTLTWHFANEGYKVPLVAFYCVRRALFDAKAALIAKRQLADYLPMFKRIVGLGSKPPQFGNFERVLSTPHIYDPPHPEFEPLPGGYLGSKLLYRSKAVDLKLRTSEIDNVKLEIDWESVRAKGLREVDGYRVPNHCEAFAWLALFDVLRNPETDVFNGYKMRMKQTLTSETFASESIPVELTNYLASQVTSWSTHLVFQNRTSGEVTKLESESGGPLPPSEMSGHIGVMSLVITRDGHVLAMYQDKMNVTAGTKLVPAGGSAEFLDFSRACGKDRIPLLGRFLRFAMQREVEEELLLDLDSLKGSALPCEGIDAVTSVTHHDYSQRVLVLGHTLDPTKGLKPDFFGVVFIRQTWEEVRHNREDLFGGPLYALPIDLSSGEALRASLWSTDTTWKSQVPPPDAFLHANLFYLREAAELIVERFASLQE